MPKNFEGGAARKMEVQPSKPEQRQKRSAAERRMSDEQMQSLREDSSRESAERLEAIGVSEAEAMRIVEENERQRAMGSEDPIEVAESAMNRYYMVFNAAMNRGNLNPEMQDDLVEALRKAKMSLEGKQEWLMHGSSAERKEMEKNWGLIKKVEGMLEIASLDPEDAMNAYTGEVNAEQLSVRHGRLENKLKQVSANVERLSKKLTDEYGISPEEMVAGGSPKGFGAKAKFWLRRLTGSQQLLEEWRSARAAEDQLIDELRKPTAGEGRYSPSAKGRAEVARRRQFETVETERREGRMAANKMRNEQEQPLPEYGSQLEREYLGSADESMAKESDTAMLQDMGDRAERARAKKTPAKRAEAPKPVAATEEMEVDLSDLEPEEEEVTQVRKKAKKPEPVSTEEIDKEWDVIAKEQEAKKRPPKKKQPTSEEVLEQFQAQARADHAVAEMNATQEARDTRRHTMTIDRAQALVPNAAKLWDFANEQLQKHLDAALAFSKTSTWTGKGVEQNPATNYVYAIAQYKEAIQNQDQEWADEMLKRIQAMNKALHISDSNALFQSTLAEKPGVKDVMKGTRQRRANVTRQNQRWSGRG